MTARRSLRAAILTLILAAPAWGQGTDQVVLTPNATVKGAGGRVRGLITKESPAEVQVQTGNTSQAVPVDQIETIIYGGQPASLTLAETREAGGDLAAAAAEYKKAMDEAGGKPFVLAAAQFNQARVTADQAMADPAKVASAVALLESFLKSNPGSRHVAPAYEALARLQLQKESQEGYAQADKAVEALAKVPGAADRAAVLRARILARRGDIDKSVAEFDALIKTSPDGSPRRRGVQLAKAEALAAAKKFDDAQKILEDVIKATPAEDVPAQSVAYNTLGDCFRAAGKPKDALDAYLHTDILYAKDKEQHPRALAHIARLWRELKRDDRAEEAMDRLKQEYPQSPYLANAPK